MLDQLPVELILDVFDHMHDGDLICMSRTNKKLRELVRKQSGTSLNRANRNLAVTFNQQKPDLHIVVYDYIQQELLNNGASTRYIGIRRKGDQVVKSRYPLYLQRETLCDSDVVYFEVTIISQEIKALPMRIGLVPPKYSDIHPPGSLQGSVGYVSTDGYVGIATTFEELFQFAPPWAQGDVVGCGYSRNATKSGSVFFTLNGNWVGDSPYRISEDPIHYRRNWYACFSSAGPASVVLNLGKTPFKYNIEHPHHQKISYIPSSVTVPKMTPNVLPKVSDPFKPPITDGYKINFPSQEHAVSRSCQSNVPISALGHKLRSFSYFEVRIISCERPETSFLSIGLATMPYSPFHHIGWDYASIGYHRYCNLTQ
jgi:SPRY domain/F-box domain